MLLKRLERGWKALFFPAVSLLLRLLAPAGPVPDWSRGQRRILILRQDRIGDAIVSTGLFRAIANISPDIRVDVLGTPANAELLRRVPYVHTVHVFDKKRPRTFLSLARRLRKERYDAVVDGMILSRSMTGLLMMLATGAPHRVGFAGRGVDAELPSRFARRQLSSTSSTCYRRYRLPWVSTRSGRTTTRN